MGSRANGKDEFFGSSDVTSETTDDGDDVKVATVPQPLFDEALGDEEFDQDIQDEEQVQASHCCHGVCDDNGRISVMFKFAPKPGMVEECLD